VYLNESAGVTNLTGSTIIDFDFRQGTSTEKIKDDIKSNLSHD
jgi:hypothetical protein